VSGFWALGTGSEDMNLSFRKRMEVARVVAETTAGRVPVLLGAAFYALEDTLSFMEETRDLEIDAYHLMVYHPLLGLDQVEWIYRHVADQSHKPLWLYSSANYGRWLPPEFLAKIKDHPNIGGVKYSTSNAVHAGKALMAADEDFQVITSVASTLLACLALGSKAHTTSLASCLPEILIRIYELFRSGKTAEALGEQRRLLAFMDALPKEAQKANFFQAATEKYILSLRGICSEYTTSYYRDLSEEEKRITRDLLVAHEIVPRSEIRN